MTEGEFSRFPWELERSSRPEGRPKSMASPWSAQSLLGYIGLGMSLIPLIILLLFLHSTRTDRSPGYGSETSALLLLALAGTAFACPLISIAMGSISLALHRKEKAPGKWAAWTALCVGFAGLLGAGIIGSLLH